jgi:hypothetical protein
MMGDQLPLKPGRQVIVKHSVNKSGGASSSGEWILAEIKKCINGDKMRSEFCEEHHVLVTLFCFQIRGRGRRGYGWSSKVSGLLEI